MESSNLIYAELLYNLRQVSLAISLPFPNSTDTRVAVTADGCAIQLTHHGETHNFQLPAKIALGSTFLPVLSAGTATLSWRLPLSPSASPAKQSYGTNTVPWSAFDTEVGSVIACRRCSAVLVPKDEVKVWKDLPGENWAEMMDFWHCHKPDDHENCTEILETSNLRKSVSIGKADGKSLALRGYGANSVITAQRGVGFIDLTTFLLSEDDCQGITVGFFNPRAAGVTLFKWQMSCSSVSSEQPSEATCLGAALVAAVARSGSSKALVTSMLGPKAASQTSESGRYAIHTWVLNSSIVYSSSATNLPMPAIKLLYRIITKDKADKMLEEVTCDVQEISLPDETINVIIQQLNDSNMVFPDAERTFQVWRVGLLPRQA